MANTLLMKKSGTANAVPASLSYGELAINYADGLLYYKNAAGTVVPLTAELDAGVVIDCGVVNPVPPGAPTSVAGTTGNTQVSLTWSAPATNGGSAISDYTVQFSSDSGSTWATFTDGVSSATSATVTGLINGTAYVFRVAAINAAGAGAYSTASASVTPAGSVVPVTFANRYGPAGAVHSVTGTSTVTAVLGGNSAFASSDVRLWLLINATGTLTYTVTASTEPTFDGGRLYITSSSPASHTGSAAAPDVASIAGLTNVSAAVTGTQTSTGTLSVSAGQYLVLRYVKDSEESGGTDSITAVVSIS